MSIDWENGRINDDQHLLRHEQMHELVGAMNDGETAYVDSDDLLADIDGGLWLTADACAFPADEASAVDEYLNLVRVIKTPAGYLVDASEGDFSLEKKTKFKFSPNHRLDPEEDDLVKVVGLIETEDQRVQAGTILFESFGIMLGASALSEVEVPDEE